MVKRRFRDVHMLLLSLLLALLFRRASGRVFPTATVADTDIAAFRKLRSRVTDTYFSNADLAAFMRGMAKECADIMAVFEFGTSAGGEALLALDISSTAGERCVRPVVCTSGS
jgi:hypothetical protein